LSPRAACRLDSLGFTEVYDYVNGKAEWFGYGLAGEGEREDERRVGAFARDDVVTCGLDERVGAVGPLVEASPYGFALVVSEGGVLLGRLRKAALEGDPSLVASDAMEEGPSTVRPDQDAGELASKLRSKDLKTAIVSTPDGRLVGVVRVSELG
jgi:CBS domain-containing protein